MDEYEKLEAELKKCYEEYMVEEYERAEQDRMEERQSATRKILEKMKQDENLRSFEGSSGPLSDDLEDSEEEEALSQGETQGDGGLGLGQSRKSSRGSRPMGGSRRVYGNMNGLEDEDSLDSDSDMLLDGDEDDSDDEELEVNEKAAESLKNRKSAKLAKALENNSDDDF